MQGLGCWIRLHFEIYLALGAMEITNNPESFDRALTRWRDSCIFYFKFDLAMVVASAAIVSFFKLEGAPLLEEAAEYQPVLRFLAYMIIYALVFEFAITTVRNLKDISTLIAHEQRSKGANGLCAPFPLVTRYR
jgi:sterol desaturase/sphingolipid hydroxylase (fatty acid hydroxylase superfamily)